MVVFDRIQATQDPIDPGYFLVTVFWRDQDGLITSKTSREDGVGLSELVGLPRRFGRVKFNSLGDRVRVSEL